MAASSPLATRPTPVFFRGSSSWKTATSSPRADATALPRKSACPASSPQAMCRTSSIARPLPALARAAWRRWTPSAFWSSRAESCWRMAWMRRYNPPLCQINPRQKRRDTATLSWRGQARGELQPASGWELRGVQPRLLLKRSNPKIGRAHV